MATVTHNSNFGISTQVGAFDQQLDSCSARVDSLENRIKAQDQFFDSTLGRGITLVGKIVTVIAAAISAACLITVIFCVATSIASTELGAQFIQVVIHRVIYGKVQYVVVLN